MNTQLHISASSKETGALLREYLTIRGVTIDPASRTHSICYGGASYANISTLNKACTTDKITRLERMTQSGVRTVPWFNTTNWHLATEYPMLARSANGYGGTDIIPVFQPEEVPWRIAAGWDWFSKYIPLVTEYRVWVTQDRHLDTYEKVMRRPQEYKYIGRNFRNGFEFQKVEKIREATVLAINALIAIGLDFGAVDMLLGKDGRYYVLEVNTAPGVLRSRAEPTLAKLADYMVRWLQR